MAKELTTEKLPQYLNKAQLDYINQKTPSKFIKTRPGRGGKQFNYVEVGYSISMLNQLFGFNWDFEITDQQVGKTQVWVRGKLVVRAGSQTIIKSQYGSGDIAFNSQTGKPVSVGDDLKGAASDCLKKCASMLGIAGDVYGHEDYSDLAEPVHERVRKERSQDEFEEGEVVGEDLPGSDDMASDKQVKYIYALCKSVMGWDSEETTIKCKDYLKIESWNDMSKAQASELIDTINAGGLK